MNETAKNLIRNKAQQINDSTYCYLLDQGLTPGEALEALNLVHNFPEDIVSELEAVQDNPDWAIQDLLDGATF